MNETAAAGRYSNLDALPMLIFVSAAMLALIILPDVQPGRLIVDRWRWYLFTGALTIVAWAAIGYLVVRFVGMKRPLMVLATLTGMTMLPVTIGPLLGWLNARLDHTPATEVTLQVSGYSVTSRAGLIGVRFQSQHAPLPEVEARKMTNFFPQPVPATETKFRAEYHPGTFGIRWISTLRSMGSYEPYKAIRR
jgi:hypothetical protein